jgi:acyl-CoA thioesterase-1
MYVHSLSTLAPTLFRLREAGVRRIAWTLSASIVLANTLAGCGGGSGSSSSIAQPSVPVAPTLPMQPVGAVPSLKTGNWVIMGSSTAAGAGAAAGKGWVALLQARRAESGDVLINLARGGASTYESLPTISVPSLNRPFADPAINIDQALARKPVLLIVAFPNNDTAAGYSVDETVNNLLAIRTSALAASIPVIVVSTQPRALPISQLSRLRELDERVMKEVGGCFVPVRAKLAGSDDKLAPAYDSGDGVHPNDLGHLLIANALDSVLLSNACVHLTR